MIGNGTRLETPEIAQGVKKNPDGSIPSAESLTPVSGHFCESGATSRIGASEGRSNPASSGFAKALRLADWSGVKGKRTETLLGSLQAGATVRPPAARWTTPNGSGGAGGRNDSHPAP